ncbi:MAG: hypothetical protein ACE5FG_13760 [Myxococcota bacterium]
MNIRLKRGGPWLCVLLASTVGITLGAGLLTFTRIQITSLRYHLNALLQRESRLRSDVEKLRVEEAALVAPRRLERRARELGLRYPQPGQVVSLGLPDVAAARPAGDDGE